MDSWPSFVKSAANQVGERTHGTQFGFVESKVQALLHGRGGILWKNLLQVRNRLLEGRACLDVLLIYLGENDLVNEKSLALIKAMKSDLLEIKWKWSGTFVLWSE